MMQIPRPFRKPRELASGLSSHKEIATRFYKYVVSHMTYDTEKAKTVKKAICRTRMNPWKAEPESA